LDIFELVELGVVAMYLLGALAFPVGVLLKNEGLKRGALALTAVGFGLHSVDLFAFIVGLRDQALLSGGFHLSVLSWALLLTFFILSRKLKAAFLSITGTPVALILFLSALGTEATTVKMPPMMGTLFFSLHIASLFISFALLFMAFVAGILFLNMDKKLKAKAKPKDFHKDLPGITLMDTANSWAVIGGFPLYTLGLLSGFVWARFTWDRMITGDPKELVSIFIWLMYAFLFHQRLAMGWRGRKPALMAMIVFVLSVLSLVGVNFLMPSHHGFQPPQP
jgi:ABC-type uncharacterized transport system permease subunit